MNKTMTMTLTTRTTSLTLSPKGEPLFSEMGTNVSIEDEGSDEFVTVTQPTTRKGIAIDPEEWPALRRAINRMVGECRQGKKESA